MPEIIRIDVATGQQEGRTSVSPQSPTSTIAQSPQVNLSGAVLAGASIMAAKTGYQTLTQEIRESGNEELATTLENISTAGMIATSIIATKGLAIIPLGIQGIASAVTRTRATQRENNATRFENELRGQRINFRGSIYE
jgi:hypothetical protein